MSPSAPELAAYGPLAIGVRTIQVTDKNRPDILNTKEGAPDGALRPHVDAGGLVSGHARGGTEARRRIQVITRDPAVTATLYGQAVRDAAPRLRQGTGVAGPLAGIRS